MIANLSNAAAVLYQGIDNINWCGFYLVKNNDLVLGPFQGNPACVRIKNGQGVCGTALKTQQTQLVEDVHQFEGHIACDAASESEIVVPIVVDTKVVAVLDIDSPTKSRFNDVDRQGIESIASLVSRFWK